MAGGIAQWPSARLTRTRRTHRSSFRAKTCGMSDKLCDGRLGVAGVWEEGDGPSPQPSKCPQRSWRPGAPLLGRSPSPPHGEQGELDFRPSSPSDQTQLSGPESKGARGPGGSEVDVCRKLGCDGEAGVHTVTKAEAQGSMSLRWTRPWLV